MSMKTATRPKPSIAVLTALVLAWTAGAPAFNQPVDTAGPLTVRIEGPEVVQQADTPLPVRVVVRNTGRQPVDGTLELGLIDRWRAAPAEPASFTVPPGGAVTQAFTVTAGKGTYSAHYPIHAYARFTVDGKPRVAHPILILRTELADPPRVTRSLAFTPVAAPSQGQLSLWSAPIYRVVIAPLGKEPQVMPVGWQGSEPTNRASVHVGPQTLGGDTRSVLFLHPPWFAGQPGHILVKWPLVLPATTPLLMRFANGINSAATGGDGVTFRVRALPIDAPAGQEGEVLFERHTAAKTWQEASVDLSRFAGKTVRLQIESHPGPKNDTSWDHSFWAEPRLVIGPPPEPVAFPPKDTSGSRLLGTLNRGNARYEVRLWPGRRGLLDATIAFSDGTRQLAFHGFEARVFGDEISNPGSPTLLVEAVEEPSEGGYQVRHRMKGLLGSFDLVGRLSVERDTLRAAFRLENTPPAEPWQACYLEDLAAGPWSATAERIYAGPGNVIRRPKAPFDLGFDGHRLATSFVGFDFERNISLVQAVDVPCHGLTVRPAERHYSIHVPHASTLTFIPAENVWDGAKVWRDVNGLKPGGGVKRAAGRFVFDLWGGRYGESADALERAFRYGLTDAMVVWHNWQRWGYDYRLPEIYPPNPQFGTLEDMQRLARVCRDHDVVFAPHDNYIDYYPDADGFSYEKQIAFYPDGQPVRAWLNEGRDAQAYRYRADVIEPILRRNLGLIRDNLAPTGYFIDVWSSAAPYDYWTAEGRFVDRQYTRDVWASQFAWIRDFLGGGVQISESGHDQLVGWLDGSQTNHLRVDRPVPGKPTWCIWDIDCADAERTPWFDAAHHDRFVCHGAGYPSRYEGGLDPRMHGIDSDDYIATEVLTGHPGMVSRPFDRNVVRKYWLLDDLMRALALRTIDGVEFDGGGSDGGDVHRQHVRWSGGGEVWVNRGKTDWTVEGTTLPEYGFLARVPTEAGPVEASIARRDGVIVESVRSPEMVYVNGRHLVKGPWSIAPSVAKVKLATDRRLDMEITWRADTPIPDGYVPFLHWVDAEGEIVLQSSHDPAALEKTRRGTIRASAGGQLPDLLQAGQTLELRVGLFHPADGERLPLVGPDDGTRRIRLGTIRLEGTGHDVTGATWTPRPTEPDPLVARLNPTDKPVDFGPVVTAGACRVTRDGDALLVTPLPEGRECTVRLRPSKLPWKVAPLRHVEALDESGKPQGRQEVRVEGEVLVIPCTPDVFAYRLAPE